MKAEIQLQREYYTRTASHYESLHVHGDGEHDLACALIQAFSSYHKFTSILDVGSGTGRAISTLRQTIPQARVVGVEPVEALRRVGHAKGIPESQLINGDATRLEFADASFDLVCELGVLHHIPQPRQAVAEMLRVAKRGIFLSDSNRFGQGSVLGRRMKLVVWQLGLWPAVNWLKTRGRGYNYGEGDGVAYSYSVFDDYDFIREQCDQVLIFNLGGSGRTALTEATHIGLFGIKKSGPAPAHGGEAIP